jgi:pyrimidine-nucleoside phosphorylase
MSMRIVDIIEKKRNGERLSKEEIVQLVDGYTKEDLPDYQMAALLMAVWFRGMDDQETSDLTMAMLDSGETVDLSGISGTTVDKHSTGGVGDTTTFVVAPLVAACGLSVAKMSGRGLGHTGGTLDKLESIPGFQVNQSRKRFVEIVERCGLAVIGQTADLAPADKKLYALRDVTGTIDSIPLIASSIMSKKLAAGSDAIVLDVKTGSGAFMRQADAAKELARTMVDIGTAAGTPTIAAITDMNQPLGLAVGNAIEVWEAVEILRGERTGDLLTVSMELATQMLRAGGVVDNDAEAKERLSAALSSGRALERFACMIEAQGGDPAVTEDRSRLPQPAMQTEVTADQDGYVTEIHAAEIGLASMVLGAGRAKKDDAIDHAVGLLMHKRIGDTVRRGEALATVYVNDVTNREEATRRVLGAVRIGDHEPNVPPLVYDVVRRDGAGEQGSKE